LSLSPSHPVIIIQCLLHANIQKTERIKGKNGKAHEKKIAWIDNKNSQYFLQYSYFVSPLQNSLLFSRLHVYLKTVRNYETSVHRCWCNCIL